MPVYAILQNPGHNRVYFQAARKLAHLEFTLAVNKLNTPVCNIREELIGGIPYLCFGTESPVTDSDRIWLSRLSFMYALFRLEKLNGDIVLQPLAKERSYFFDDDEISSMLKYNGKTNELFTRMMMNTAIFCAEYDISEGFTILDPLCGKGTTLFEGLLYGFHVYGVELDDKMVHEAYIFLKKYLEKARYKHTTHIERVTVNNNTAQRYRIELSRNKSDEKSGKILNVDMVAGDTRNTSYYYRKNSVHIIIADLPYGVQHSSKNNKKDFSRNALPLLNEALPEWYKVLKPGGVMALAWNLFLIPRKEMESVLKTHGFILPEGEVFSQFTHRVDQAIERDVIIGMKK
jgi:SAM-dependent methyltransferase